MLGGAARALDEAGERGGEVAARAGRPGQRDEVEPAVRLLGGEGDALVGRGRRDELDPAELRPVAGGEVGDDQALGAGGAGVLGEPVPAVRLEDRGVGHRHERHLHPGARRGQALEAGARPHPGGERLLGCAADHRAVGERVGEREADLDEVGAARLRRSGEVGRVGAGHQVDDEPLGHGRNSRASFATTV